MIKTLALISQSYLNFASADILDKIASHVKVILFISDGEEIDAMLSQYVNEVHFVESEMRSSLRPVLSHMAIIQILREEAKKLPSPKMISVFCQQEDNVLTAAYVREALELDGDKIQDVVKFRDKVVMKDTIEKGLPDCTPKFAPLDMRSARDESAKYYSDLTKRLGKKLIIKPTSGAGSVNVKIVNNLQDFEIAINDIANDKYDFAYEVDEFIDGKMYQCDSVIFNNEVYFAGILELGCSNFDFVCGEPLSVFPIFDGPLFEALSAFNKQVIKALSFESGSTHLEVFVSDDNEKITFLEVAARVPGGIGVPYHQRNSNVNMVDANLLMSCRMDMPFYVKPHPRNNVASALLPLQNGKIIELIKPDIKSKFDLQWYVSVGDVVESNSLADTAGIPIFSNDNSEQLRRDFHKLKQYRPVRVA